MPHRREKCPFSWYVCQTKFAVDQRQWNRSINIKCCFNLMQDWHLQAESKPAINMVSRLKRHNRDSMGRNGCLLGHDI